MARRGRKRKTPSLFPFLSVLLCAMGVLIVVISAQNLIVVGGEIDQVLEVGGGEYDDRQAIYVECREDLVVIFPERWEVPLDSIKESNARTKFDDLLDRLEKNNREEFLVLLIRPDGVETYFQCLYRVEERNYEMSGDLLGGENQIQVGKDALLPGGELILTEDGKPYLPTPEDEI